MWPKGQAIEHRPQPMQRAGVDLDGARTSRCDSAQSTGQTFTHAASSHWKHVRIWFFALAEHERPDARDGGPAIANGRVLERAGQLAGPAGRCSEKELMTQRLLHGLQSSLTFLSSLASYATSDVRCLFAPIRAG